MEQEGCWLVRYNEVMEFMEREHRKPLKYYLPSVKNKQMRCLNGANRRLMGVNGRSCVSYPCC